MTESKAVQLQCMEIVGGNQAVRHAVRTPGLDVWVESRPFQGEVGGDIHYFSVCGSGRVTRLAVADVAGHGEGADELAAWLRGRMRKHINLLDQRRFAQEINRELASRMQTEDDSRFATVALLTYFAPTDHLIVCNAGHPPPLWYSQRSKQWELLEPGLRNPGRPLSQEHARYLGRSVANLPLGVVEGTKYVQFAVKLSAGDIVVAYTDGLVEARNPAGTMLGQEGLLSMAAYVGAEGEPQAISERLLAAVDAYQGSAGAEDDATVAVIRHTAADPPTPTLGQVARLLPKVLGLHSSVVQD